MKKRFFLIPMLVMIFALQECRGEKPDIYNYIVRLQNRKYYNGKTKPGALLIKKYGCFPFFLCGCSGFAVFTAFNEAEIYPVELELSAEHKDELKKYIPELDSLIEQDENNPELRFQRALAYYYLGDYSAASGDLHASLFKLPKFSEAFFFLATVLDRMNLAGEAFLRYERSYYLDPEGTTGRIAGEKMKVLESLINEQGFPDKSEESRFYTERALNVFMARKFEQALDLLDTAMQIEPENPLVYDTRSIVYYNMKRLSEGIADCNKAMELHEKAGRHEAYMDVLTRRGAFYLNKREYHKAILDFDRVIEDRPGFSFAYYDRGRCYFDLGDYEKARADFEKSLEFKPEEGFRRNVIDYLEKIKEMEKNI